MTAVLFENISELRTVSALGTLANAAIVADDGRIAWIGPTKIAVLGRASAGSDRALYSVKIGGPSERLMAPYTGAVAITAGRDEGSIIVLTDKNVAYSREGGSWRAIASSVTAVALPG